MELYGVYLGISNGVENWLVHAIIDGGEGFFIVSSPVLMTKTQADRVMAQARETPYVAKFRDTLQSVPLLTVTL